jgi:hypothetical protein
VDAPVTTGIPIRAAVPARCARCLEISTNFSDADQNALHTPVLLYPNVTLISD